MSQNGWFLERPQEHQYWFFQILGSSICRVRIERAYGIRGSSSDGGERSISSRKSSDKIALIPFLNCDSLVLEKARVKELVDSFQFLLGCNSHIDSSEHVLLVSLSLIGVCEVIAR